MIPSELRDSRWRDRLTQDEQQSFRVTQVFADGGIVLYEDRTARSLFVSSRIHLEQNYRRLPDQPNPIPEEHRERPVQWGRRVELPAPRNGAERVQVEDTALECDVQYFQTIRGAWIAIGTPGNIRFFAEELNSRGIYKVFGGKIER